MATEAVLDRLNALGFETGLDLERVSAVGRFARSSEISHEDFETLKIERDERGVLTLWLNRPDKKNALSGQCIEELTIFARDVQQILRRGWLCCAARAFLRWR